MEATSSIELTEPEQARLLEVAAGSIVHGFAHGTEMSVTLEDFPEKLQIPSAVFVTLLKAGELRGCIGGLRAQYLLPQAVAHSAYQAAFSDPRFPPLREEEWDDCEVKISVLTEPWPIDVASRQELEAALEVGRHGLIIRKGGQAATFLPSVWEQLPDKGDFVEALMRKGGISSVWTPQIRCLLYEAQSF